MPEKTKEKWVSLGSRLTGDGKLAAVWKKVESGILVGDELWFSTGKKSSMKHASVGAVYTIDVTRDGEAVRAGRDSYVSMWEDSAKLAEWRALTDAAQLAARMKREERSAKERDFYGELLAPLRSAYLRSDPIGRQVILVKVLRAIQHGN